MAKLIVTRGLPASGKTTWARKYVEEDPENRVRINRDDLRIMTNNYHYSPGYEKLILSFRDRLIDEALCKGYDVVNDDTNLPQKTVRDLARIARQTGSEFEVVDLTHVELEVCRARNHLRMEAGERGVPESVLIGFWNRYLKGRTTPLPLPTEDDSSPLYTVVKPDITKPAAMIFDIDGTIAHMNGRSPYDYSLVSTDLPDRHVIAMAQTFNDLGYQIIFLSGRKRECYDDTYKWLLTYTDIKDFILLMRGTDDNRRDAIVKYELFDKLVRPHYNVLGVFDDRNQVVEMWRKIGLKCYQVQEGDF